VVAKRLGGLRVVLRVVLLLLVVGLAACGEGNGDGSGGAGAGGGGALTPVNFRLGWVVTGDMAPYYIAHQEGYFEDEGLDVTIIPGTGSSVNVTQLGTGTIEFGEVAGDVLVQGRGQGVPVTAVAAVYQSTPVAITSRADAPIKTPEQLTEEDVTLGVAKASAAYQGLTLMLESQGIDPADIDQVEIGFAGADALASGKVDAFMAYANDDAIQAEDAGVPVHNMMVRDWGVDSYGTTIAVNAEWAAENGNLVEAFMRAVKKGVDDVVADPPAGINAAAGAFPDLDQEFNLKILKASIPLWSSDATEENGFGYMTEEQWQNTLDVAKAGGLLEQEVAIEDLYTNQYLGE
jgi:NitT/TauT family transport system substrate-binding protein